MWLGACRYGVKATRALDLSHALSHARDLCPVNHPPEQLQTLIGESLVADIMAQTLTSIPKPWPHFRLRSSEPPGFS